MTKTSPALANARRMTARFPGRCCTCGVRFPAGTTILFAKGATAHAVCPTAEEVAAAPVVAEPVRAMVAVAPFVAALTAARAALTETYEAAKAVLAPLDEAAAQAAVAAGWCQSCNGQGFVAWFDTDYDCGCRGEGKTGGYSRAYAVSQSPAAQAAEAAALPARAEVARIAAEIEAVSRKLSRLQNPEKGDAVEVFKGRKVPVGTKGTMIWRGAGRKHGYYDRPADRVGVKDEAGTVHWTAITNVRPVEIPAEDAARWSL